MSHSEITAKDRELALQCINCAICKRARNKQRGLIFLAVKYLERGVCPACQAYEKVYGKKAHEPMA